MSGKWLIAGAWAVIGAAAAFTLLRSVQTRKEDTSASAAAPPAASEIILAGEIRARQLTPVKALVAGEIEEFLVEAGEEVFEGQLLARISNTGLEAAREQAATSAGAAQERVEKANSTLIAARLEASRARADATRARGEFERAQKNAERQRFLHRQGATPRLAYEKAQREFETADAEFRSLDELARQAEERVSDLLRDQQSLRRELEEKRRELEEADQDLTAAEVRAPVSGLVAARRGAAGERAGPDEESRTLFQIATDPSALEVLVEPPAGVAQRLRPDMPALVFVADVEEGLPGTVRKLDGGRVAVEFASPNSAVRPGMTAQVRIRLEPPDAEAASTEGRRPIR